MHIRTHVYVLAFTHSYTYIQRCTHTRTIACTRAHTHARTHARTNTNTRLVKWLVSEQSVHLHLTLHFRMQRRVLRHFVLMAKRQMPQRIGDSADASPHEKAEHEGELYRTTSIPCSRILLSRSSLSFLIFPLPPFHSSLSALCVCSVLSLPVS